MVYLSEHTCHSGLAGTGVAGKDGMEDHVAAGVETFALTLKEETGLVGHCPYACLDIVESHHLIQFAHALVV